MSGRRLPSGLDERIDRNERLISARVRERRILMGMSQAQLAAIVGVTFQQLHKYEVGRSRIAAGRLFDFAQALEVPVAYFFDGLGGSDDGPPTRRMRMLLELVRNFEGLSAMHQRMVLNMSAALAAERHGASTGEAIRPSRPRSATRKSGGDRA